MRGTLIISTRLRGSLSRGDCVRPTSHDNSFPIVMGLASPTFFGVCSFRFLRNDPFATSSLTDNVSATIVASSLTHHLFNAARRMMKHSFDLGCVSCQIYKIIHDTDCLASGSCTRLCVPCAISPSCDAPGCSLPCLKTFDTTFLIRSDGRKSTLQTRVGRVYHGRGLVRPSR